jgi:hypothetical protein
MRNSVNSWNFIENFHRICVATIQGAGLSGRAV